MKNPLPAAAALVALALLSGPSLAAQEGPPIEEAARQFGCESVEYGPGTAPGMPAWSEDAAFHGKVLEADGATSEIFCRVDAHPDRTRAKLRVGERSERAGQAVTVWHGRMGGRKMTLEVADDATAAPRTMAECYSKRVFGRRPDAIRCDIWIDRRKAFAVRATLGSQGSFLSVLRFVGDAGFPLRVDPARPAVLASPIGTLTLEGKGARFGKGFAFESAVRETTALLPRWLEGKGQPVTLTFGLAGGEASPEGTEAGERTMPIDFTTIAPSYVTAYAMARRIAGR
ncbi:MAG: hypothetical protein RIB52_07440 [Erythrobacter sp.]|uniref:hypothetical protein n=1 Tax=Erythrobacter sp. TaxID=1042 RepID=UPI0032EEEF90